MKSINISVVITKEEFLLTISPKYIPAWGKWEALRELMQNVIDRYNEEPRAEIIFTYSPLKQRLIVGNKFSLLERKTLIMGETSKADNDSAIGKYGEGYKLALMVLLRLGARIRIRTAGEVWAPIIKYSEQFETDLLAIGVIKSKVASESLLFEIDGITQDDYKELLDGLLPLTRNWSIR
jgi:hypothetical protein